MVDPIQRWLLKELRSLGCFVGVSLSCERLNVSTISPDRISLFLKEKGTAWLLDNIFESPRVKLITEAHPVRNQPAGSINGMAAIRTSASHHWPAAR